MKNNYITPVAVSLLLSLIMSQPLLAEIKLGNIYYDKNKSTQCTYDIFGIPVWVQREDINDNTYSKNMSEFDILQYENYKVQKCISNATMINSIISEIQLFL